MSAHAARTTTAFSSEGLSHPIRRLWEELTSRSALPRDVEKLSDHLLVDIGVDPRFLSDSARNAADRLQLLERGWQRSSRLDHP